MWAVLGLISNIGIKADMEMIPILIPLRLTKQQHSVGTVGWGIT